MAAESSGSAVPMATGPSISDALQEHLSGRLSLDEYVDAQVELSIVHLKGRVSNERLQSIREVLREQVTQAPGYLELLARAGIRLPASTAT